MTRWMERRRCPSIPRQANRLPIYRTLDRTTSNGPSTQPAELAGKHAMIVFLDIDPEEVADAVISGMNLTVCQGQSCGSTSRILLHDDVHDDVIGTLR